MIFLANDSAPRVINVLYNVRALREEWDGGLKKEG